jgi:hypothetical protein
LISWKSALSATGTGRAGAAQGQPVDPAQWQVARQRPGALPNLLLQVGPAVRQLRELDAAVQGSRYQLAARVRGLCLYIQPGILVVDIRIDGQRLHPGKGQRADLQPPVQLRVATVAAGLHLSAHLARPSPRVPSGQLLDQGEIQLVRGEGQAEGGRIQQLPRIGDGRIQPSRPGDVDQAPIGNHGLCVHLKASLLVGDEVYALQLLQSVQSPVAQGALQ